MSITINEWVTRLRDEYLLEFIADGGAAVKIAVATPELRDAVAPAVRQAADGYLTAHVDAAQTKVHMVHQLFHAVARQVDWDGMAERWLRAALPACGILVEPEQPFSDMETIAHANGRSVQMLYGDINRLITNGILCDYRMGKEFRTAMAMLCLWRINPQNVSSNDAEMLKQWLIGERCNLSALKRMQIHQRIGRHNARLLLASLATWSRLVGYRGFVLTLDLTTVIENDVSLLTPVVRYSRAAVLDTYEVLRQCIDEVDEMTHFLLVAITGGGLLDPNNPRRNVDNYTALKLRIIDEVHDKHRANPLNVMVRLGEPAPEGAAV
ncbi:MAG TPA: BREX system ATP-binding domain-containing protein [Armatimonadota bacterium]